jgi:hypothetical protein
VPFSGPGDEALAGYRRGHGIKKQLTHLALGHADFMRDLAWFETRPAERK